jgi:hypothetical protein
MLHYAVVVISSSRKVLGKFSESSQKRRALNLGESGKRDDVKSSLDHVTVVSTFSSAVVLPCKGKVTLVVTVVSTLSSAVVRKLWFMDRGEWTLETVMELLLLLELLQEGRLEASGEVFSTPSFSRRKSYSAMSLMSICESSLGLKGFVMTSHMPHARQALRSSGVALAVSAMIGPV